MFRRIGVLALNTYREAVRARILHGLFAAALGTGGYSLIVGGLALTNHLRVVSDLGGMFISLFSLITAVVLIATSLYREVELKTIFPILARPVRRTEYLVGKFTGTMLTLLVFVVANVGALLLALGALTGKPLWLVLLVGLGSTALLAALSFRLPRWRSYFPIPWALCLFVPGYLMAANAAQDRAVLVGLASLALFEVAVVTAMATVFAAFSSPFLTAVFTFGLLLVGRSAETLARLPEKVFGAAIHDAGSALSKVVPNLMVYVPERSVLLGEVADTPPAQYLALAGAQAALWTVGLLAFASLVFRRRDFL